MTTSDARKRLHERDMADAHATARARDALGKHPGHSLLAKPRAKAGHPMTWFVFDEAQHFCTRTHAIHPETGEFTPLTQEPEMTVHRAMAERALDAIDDSDDPRNLPAGLDGIGRALLAIHDTLTEIRDRLPEQCL